METAERLEAQKKLQPQKYSRRGAIQKPEPQRAFTDSSSSAMKHPQWLQEVGAAEGVGLAVM